MRIPRIYQPHPLMVGTTTELTGSAATHVARVLRLREGAPLTLFNGAGGEFSATVAKVDRRKVSVLVEAHHDRESESPLPLTLAQGISKGERMDYTIQKAVELGVTQIIPLQTERSVVNLSGERMQRKLEHWRAIIISASEQCGRNRLTELVEVTNLKQFLDAVPQGTPLLLDHRSEGTITDLNLQAATLLIGPEGGLSTAERKAAQLAGFIGTRLGPRVLRTETAAVTAISLLQGYFGDLN